MDQGNVLVCGGCDAVHHPGCFETKNRCGSCSGRDAMLVPAAAVPASTARLRDTAREWTLWSLDFCWFACAVAVFQLGLSFKQGVVAFLATWIAVSLLRSVLGGHRKARLLEGANAAALRPRLPASVAKETAPEEGAGKREPVERRPER